MWLMSTPSASYEYNNFHNFFFTTIDVTNLIETISLSHKHAVRASVVRVCPCELGLGPTRRAIGLTSGVPGTQPKAHL